MKKIAFGILILTTITSTVIAQNYKAIKDKLALNQLNFVKSAKDDFDKAITNPKFSSKAEAFILKTAIYATLSMDTTIAQKNESTQLIIEAESSFKKYREMDPKDELIDDPIYRIGPSNLYYALYYLSSRLYDSSKLKDAAEKAKYSIELLELLQNKKVKDAQLDDNDVLILLHAADCSDKAGNVEDAAKLYTKVTESKVTNKYTENAYRFLVRYYYLKNDSKKFNEYLALGKSMFPKSDFFDLDMVDFANGLSKGFTERLKAIEDVLKTDAENFKANMVLASIIYDTLNSEAENWVAPEKADELEKRMVECFYKAAKLQPNNEYTYLYVGAHFIRKAKKTNEARSTHAADMKARTKPGTMASKDDIAKRDMLDKKYGDELENARDPYEKAGTILSERASKEGGLEIREKGEYKNLANYLARIYEYKKIQAKAKPADQAKFAAEEKKWDEVYETINSIKTLKKGHENN